MRYDPSLYRLRVDFGGDVRWKREGSFVSINLTPMASDSCYARIEMFLRAMDGSELYRHPHAGAIKYEDIFRDREMDVYSYIIGLGDPSRVLNGMAKNIVTADAVLTVTLDKSWVYLRFSFGDYKEVKKLDRFFASEYFSYLV